MSDSVKKEDEMLRAKVNARNQIVIPAEARERLGIKPGDQMLFLVRDKTMILIPEPENHVEALRGFGKEIWAGIDTDEWLQRERDSWSK